MTVWIFFELSIYVYSLYSCWIVYLTYLFNIFIAYILLYNFLSLLTVDGYFCILLLDICNTCHCTSDNEVISPLLDTELPKSPPNSWRPFVIWKYIIRSYSNTSNFSWIILHRVGYISYSTSFGAYLKFFWQICASKFFTVHHSLVQTNMKKCVFWSFLSLF